MNNAEFKSFIEQSRESASNSLRNVSPEQIADMGLNHYRPMDMRVVVPHQENDAIVRNDDSSVK